MCNVGDPRERPFIAVDFLQGIKSHKSRSATVLKNDEAMPSGAQNVVLRKSPQIHIPFHRWTIPRHDVTNTRIRKRGVHFNVGVARGSSIRQKPATKDEP